MLGAGFKPLYSFVFDSASTFYDCAFGDHRLSDDRLNDCDFVVNFGTFDFIGSIDSGVLTNWRVNDNCTATDDGTFIYSRIFNPSIAASDTFKSGVTKDDGVAVQPRIISKDDTFFYKSTEFAFVDFLLLIIYAIKDKNFKIFSCFYLKNCGQPFRRGFYSYVVVCDFRYPKSIPP